MKRSLVFALILGLVAAAVAGVLHASGVLLRLETAALAAFSHHRMAVGSLGSGWHYTIMVLVALLVSWLTFTSLRRVRIAVLTLILLVELAGMTWICSLYRVAFQALPSMLAAVLAFALAAVWVLLSTRTRANLAKTFFAERLSSSQIHRVIEGEIPLETDAKSYEVTVVVCDIANKYDMVEESDPTSFAEASEAFIQRTTALFLEAGGFIQAADGEGVVAIFGFPDSSGDHADKAVRVTLGLVEDVIKKRQQNNGDLFGRCDVHMGVSSGSIIVAPLRHGEKPGLLTVGEPVELARRFCVANRFYGSRILIGPRTFELASKHIVARPIDFLSGVNSQERHEIYEPLWLAAQAKPEHIARRDFFWNGVVLYREKRWAEAYTEFQKARGPDGDEDAPLQLYLRRLETLALHLTTAAE